ncbi:hypothetical protein ACFFRR_005575 [Megaselia abdita]
MEFAFKIDRHVKANLYRICRLCGIENSDMIKILKSASDENQDEDEPELSAKILICLGIEVTSRDKMPQSCCSLCSDKIDDFWEFREMCYATNAQTRKLLGLRELKNKPKPELKPEIKVPIKEDTPPPPPSPEPHSAMSTRKRKTIVLEKEELVPIKQSKKDCPPKLSKEKEAIPAPPQNKSNKEVKVVLKDMKAIKFTSKDNIQKKGTLKDGKHAKDAKDKPTKDSNKEKSNKDYSKDKLNKDLKKIKDLRRSKVPESRSPSPIPVKRITRRDAEINKSKVQEPDPVPGPSEKNKKSKDKEIKEEIKEEPVDKKIIEKKDNNAEKKSLPVKKMNNKCKICPESFPTSQLLSSHCKEKHLPTIWRYHCFYCYEPLQKNVDIKNHNLWHRLSKTPFQCASCREEFSTAYNLSKHTKECSPFIPIIDPRKVLPDSTCLDCKSIFLTPYLFNIHDCVLKKQVCPGCQLNIPQIDKFLVHVAICDNTTRYFPDNLVLSTSIKQEPNPTAQMVVLETNQCVAIPAAQVSLRKKSSKSMKSTLQRVSELLNSTFSQLESIKQEPSTAEQVENEIMSEDDYNQENFTQDEHFGNASSHEEDEVTEDIDIKPELIENTNIDPVPLPILKLKIKMEHGKLNSSIVDTPESLSRVQSPVKSFSPRTVSSPVEIVEKKKNKKNKKRKLLSDEDTSVSMPIPGIIRIKKEKVDSGYEDKEKGLKVSIVQSGLNQSDFKQERDSDEELEGICTANLNPTESEIKLEQAEESYKEELEPSNLTLKISSVQSGVLIKQEETDENYEEIISDTGLPAPFLIKEEPSLSVMIKQEELIEVKPEIIKDDEEEETYIKSIDFSNVIIKQEKGLEINDIFEEVDQDDEAIVNIDVESSTAQTEYILSDEKCLVLEPQIQPYCEEGIDDTIDSDIDNFDLNNMTDKKDCETSNVSYTFENNKNVQIKEERKDDLNYQIEPKEDHQENISVSKPQSISADDFFKENSDTISTVLAVSYAKTISAEEFTDSQEETVSNESLAVEMNLNESLENQTQEKLEMSPIEIAVQEKDNLQLQLINVRPESTQLEPINEENINLSFQENNLDFEKAGENSQCKEGDKTVQNSTVTEHESPSLVGIKNSFQHTEKNDLIDQEKVFSIQNYPNELGVIEDNSKCQDYVTENSDSLLMRSDTISQQTRSETLEGSDCSNRTHPEVEGAVLKDQGKISSYRAQIETPDETTDSLINEISTDDTPGEIPDEAALKEIDTSNTTISDLLINEISTDDSPSTILDEAARKEIEDHASQVSKIGDTDSLTNEISNDDSPGKISDEAALKEIDTSDTNILLMSTDDSPSKIQDEATRKEIEDHASQVSKIGAADLVTNEINTDDSPRKIPDEVALKEIDSSDTNILLIRTDDSHSKIQEATRKEIEDHVSQVSKIVAADLLTNEISTDDSPGKIPDEVALKEIDTSDTKISDLLINEKTTDDSPSKILTEASGKEIEGHASQVSNIGACLESLLLYEKDTMYRGWNSEGTSTESKSIEKNTDISCEYSEESKKYAPSINANETAFQNYGDQNYTVYTKCESEEILKVEERTMSSKDELNLTGDINNSEEVPAHIFTNDNVESSQSHLNELKLEPIPPQMDVGNCSIFNSNQEQIEPLNYSTGHKSLEDPEVKVNKQYSEENENKSRTEFQHINYPENPQEKTSASSPSNESESDIHNGESYLTESTSNLNLNHHQENNCQSFKSIDLPSNSSSSQCNSIQNSAIEATENQFNETIEENTLNENNFSMMDNTNEIAENHNNENLLREKELFGADDK